MASRLISGMMAWTSIVALGFARTIYTGDVLHGYQVIESLDVRDVPANTISRFWISPAAGQGGLPYFLPVFVARGSEASLESGRKLSISASIHGDELSPVAVIQKVFARLNNTVTSGDFNGTVIGLPTQNPQGNVLNQRNFFTSSSSGFFTDLNRNFPGANIGESGSLPEAYAASIWNNVWGNTSNVDVAVDFREFFTGPRYYFRLTQASDTLGTGSLGPLWCYADYRLDGVRRIAELAEPDMIKIDAGEPGSIETTWVENGTPAITLEIGPANLWNQSLIRRAVDFTFRLMDDLQMTDSEPHQPDLSSTFIATNFSNPSVSRSGWVEMDISVLADVAAGQVIGRAYNSWGDVIEVLTSEVSGRVLTVLTDPAVEAGAEVATIGYNATVTEKP